MSDTQQGTTALVEAPKAEVPAVRQLPEPVARRGITEAQWLTLCNTLFPGAASASVLLVWDYCSARKLDPMKKPCHIVPMRVKDAKTGEWGWRDVVMPGIYEYRITAHRTGLYLGHTEPEYGPEFDYKGVKAFEWCAMTFYRWNEKASTKVAFPVKVFFKEVVALTKEGNVNDRWTRAGVQMHTKCTEAAGLREAFPEEIGGEPTVEEMEGRTIHMEVSEIVPPVLTALDKIPEGMRDNIERGFATLEMSPGQRITKANEFLGDAATDPEEGAQKLLDWLKDEYAKKAGRPRAKKADNGKKKDETKATDPIPMTTQSAATVVAKEDANKAAAEETKPAETVKPAAATEDALF